MKLNLLPLMSGQAEELPFKAQLTFEEAPIEYAEFSFDGPVSTEGYVRSLEGCLELSLSVSVRLKTFCARCLLPMTKELSVEECFPFDPNGEAEDGFLTFVSHQVIDLSETVRELLLLNVDTQYFCREDCKGLCGRCGKDLNEGACACREEAVVDPRLLKLKDFL